MRTCTGELIEECAGLNAVTTVTKSKVAQESEHFVSATLIGPLRDLVT